MPTLQDALLFLVLLPAAVTAGVVLLTKGRRWGVVLGLGAGYLAGHLAYAWPPFPPGDVTDRVPWLALAATVLGLVESFWPASDRLRNGCQIVLAATAAAAILGPLDPSLVTGDIGYAWIAAGIACVVWAANENLAALGQRMDATVLAWSLAALLAGTGGVLYKSGTLIGAIFSVILAVPLVTLGLCNLRTTAPGLSSPGTIPVVATLLTALVLFGRFYAEMPTGSALILAAAPGVIWGGRIGLVSRMRRWKAALIVVVALLVPLGAALGLAIAAEAPAESAGE